MKQVKSIKRGDKFRVSGLLAVHLAQSDAMVCHRGYIRIETLKVGTRGGAEVTSPDCVNVHGTTECVLITE